VSATPFVIVTCEHGGNRVPAPWKPLFRDAGALLATHRGYDAGALSMARMLASAFGAPLIASTVSRLLVDLNRSVGHRGLYSDATRPLGRAEHEHILALCYRPYRDEVETHVARAVAARRQVVHISSHSFTPVLDGEERRADVALLYDPARGAERSLCRTWGDAIGRRIAPLRVRRNYPYQGRNDGLTSHLRRRFAPAQYVGIELEVNQKHLRGQRFPTALSRAIIESLREALAPGTRPRRQSTNLPGPATAVHASGAAR
jgi:predicted N-formylglutamate amidohydrolase